MRKIYVSVNGHCLEVGYYLADELEQDRDARAAYIESVVQSEAAFKSEQRWGPGKLVKIGPSRYQWKTLHEPN